MHRIPSNISTVKNKAEELGMNKLSAPKNDLLKSNHEATSLSVMSKLTFSDLTVIVLCVALNAGVYFMPVIKNTVGIDWLYMFIVFFTGAADSCLIVWLWHALKAKK